MTNSSNVNLKIYDFWVSANLEIPTRSYLYNLEPIKIGDTYGESLISYTMRLAEAHSISIQSLFVQVISASVANKSNQNQQRNELKKVLNRGAALNSNGTLAQKLVSSLQSLTTKEYLYNLTLLSYKNIFSSKNLFKYSKTWCPLCFQEWKESNQIVYEPLLWLFADMKICSKHLQPLQDICPSCQKTIPWLAGNSRVGYCSHCRSWLGNISQLSQKNVINQSQINFSQSLWITETLGNLVACIPQANSFPEKINISEALKQVIEITHQGNIAAFSRVFGFPKNTVWTWCNSKNQPELGAILKICNCLNISLVDFISLKQGAFELVKIHSERLPSFPPSSRRSPKVFDKEKIKNYLQEVLNDPATPPINLQKVSEVLDFDKRTISNHFPDLCKAITRKCRSHRKLKTEKRIKNCCQEIEEIVHNLCQSGECPTEARVSKLLSNPGHLRYKEARTTLENAIANVIVN